MVESIFDVDDSDAFSPEPLVRTQSSHSPSATLCAIDVTDPFVESKSKSKARS